LRVDLVGKRARRPEPGLLRRHRLLGRGNGDEVRMLAVIRRLVGRGVRQLDPAGVGLLEIERRGEVAADRATPRGDVGLDQAGAALREAPLDEADERRVVEQLRAHPAALAPGRDHDHGYADAQAVWARWIPLAPAEDLEARVDRGPASPLEGWRR